MASAVINSPFFPYKTINRKTGKPKTGFTDTRLETIYTRMRHRCLNPKDGYYHLYGGRGITICPEWLENRLYFYKWALENGYSDELQLDRLDSDKGYSPENCRWATHFENQNNRRKHIRVEWQGKTQTLGEWARELGANHGTLWNRWKAGCTTEQIFAEPLARSSPREYPSRKRCNGKQS
jgi:hypothetical protein